MQRSSFPQLVLAALLLSVPAVAQSTDRDSAAVHFVQGMMHHHAQAIVMGEMAPSHTARTNLRTAARRIVASQTDEIAVMRRWLERRHAAVPSINTSAPDMMSHSMPGMDMGGMQMASDSLRMPGMVTHEQLMALARSRGTKFDKLFGRFMIAHHEGALKMVADLFAIPGATDDPELFQLTSDIDADQRAEIARMRSMLTAKPDMKTKHKR
ncbi:MAG: DUF305 domain-containing protein [Gemmatimonadaceae bacterium]|nr:DUF305 domain-containing protein [Gemmatimonadaceae bacterium]